MKNHEQEDLLSLLEQAKQGENSVYRYLFNRFKGLVFNIINKGNYFIQGGDRDDLVQEGMIGLSKAIRDFDPSYNKKFEMFAQLCIERQLISAIKTATRKKNIAMNEYVSFDRTLPDNNNLSMMDIIGSKKDLEYVLNDDYLDPEKQLILKESRAYLESLIEKKLSDKEREIYHSSMENNSYKEIMEDLNIAKAKTIDNGIQRMRKKFEKIQELYAQEENQENN